MKLSKEQIVAIANKLYREIEFLYEELKAKDIVDFELSELSKTIIELSLRKEKLREEADALGDKVIEMCKLLGVKQVYSHTKVKDIADRLRESEIDKKYTVPTIESLIDDIVISSVAEPFNPDIYIKEYVNKLKNEC